MNDLQFFKSEEFGEVRILLINDEIWFIGKDVASILGYERPDNAIRNHIEEEDKLMHQISASGQNRKMILINESGLYSLILSSKLPKAKEFKRWVTNEVLPSIRKHGGYLTSQKIEEILSNPDTIIKLATDLKNEREKNKKLIIENTQKENKIKEMKPKVIFAKSVESSKTNILIGELAKILKQNGIEIGQNRLFEDLRNEGYLIKSGSSRNLPTQKSMELNLFKIKESTLVNRDGSIRVTRTTKVTGKGQIYFVNKYYKKFKKNLDI